MNRVKSEEQGAHHSSLNAFCRNFPTHFPRSARGFLLRFWPMATECDLHIDNASDTDTLYLFLNKKIPFYEYTHKIHGQ